MLRKKQKSNARMRVGLLAGAALLTGLATAALAVTHPDIPLLDAGGNSISAAGGTAAFSMKKTCGTSSCHDGSTPASTGRTLLSYDQIERHSYHAQLASNEQRGWNNWNPDSADPLRNGAQPIGKNWVQGPGHVGAW
ncbi:MAG: cytochrome C [Geobacter sp.]|nr:cytochrome C [Geobacter sp.]